MKLSELRSQSATEKRVVKGGSQTCQLYIDTLARIHRPDPSNPARAFEQAEWLLDPDGADLRDVADVLLLRAQAAALLPDSHPEHAPSITGDELRRLFENRSLAGKFHQTCVQTVGADPATPMPQATIEWRAFKASWPFFDAESIAAAWALHLSTQKGDFETADQVLATRDESVPLTHAARLALLWETQRWTDLHEVATTARSATFRQPTADNPANVALDPVLSAIAAACDARALVSLSRFEEARPMLDAAEHSQLGMSAAWGYYLDGLMLRAEGKETKARENLSLSLQEMHTPFAAAALADESVKLRQTTAANIAARSDKWLVETEPDPEMEAARTKKDRQNSYRTQADALMDQVVGMEGVKAQVKRLRNTVRITEERRRRSGGGDTPASYNLVLTGPPGTGKSTIVRAITLYLAGEGIVEDPEPMITGKADFVSGYIGQTPEKTAETVNKARGKVLFIDEFYQMVQDGGAGSNSENHGQDAIDTLVGLIEERIGVTTFIIAGYPDDMDRVLQTNAGLESRFPRRIRFESFDQEQFVAVAEKKAQEKNVALSAAAVEWLSDPASDVRLMYQESPGGRPVVDVLGNGRFARNVVERACEEQALRLAEVEDLTTLDDDALNTLSLEDVRTAFMAYVNHALYSAQTE